ncbi:hypothetical protein M8494_03135 [Serratia ureilytica]
MKGVDPSLYHSERICIGARRREGAGPCWCTAHRCSKTGITRCWCTATVLTA